MKFRGAGQGPKALVAEVIAGGLRSGPGPARARPGARGAGPGDRGGRAALGGQGAAGPVAGHEPQRELPARGACVRPVGRAATGPRPGRGDCLVRRAGHEPRPHGTQRQPAGVAWARVLHRPWGFLFAHHRWRVRSPRRGAHSRGSPATCFFPSRPIPRPTRGWPRSSRPAC